MACNRIRFPLSPCGTCVECITDINQWKSEFSTEEGCRVVPSNPIIVVSINNNKRPADEQDLVPDSKR
jgi:hypothetical protein